MASSEQIEAAEGALATEFNDREDWPTGEMLEAIIDGAISSMRQLTVFYVGRDSAHALEGLPFDDSAPAEEYARDNGEKVYSFYAYVDPSSAEQVET